MMQYADQPDVLIRPFESKDQKAVTELFKEVNRRLAPKQMAHAFEDYIARSIKGEVGDITSYYDGRKAWFYVATLAQDIIGMFGLEKIDADTVELRRMYVAPALRGKGLGRKLLVFTEQAAQSKDFARLILSTSELQPEALNLYRKSGFTEIGIEKDPTPTNKALGGGIARVHFKKLLATSQQPLTR